MVWRRGSPMSVLVPNLMRERVLELEKAVETLSVRLSLLQQQVASARSQALESRSAVVWDWKSIMKRTFTRKKRAPIRENRRMEAHDVCSAGNTREQLRRPVRGLRSSHGKTNPVF